MREDLRSALEKDNIAADRLSEARFQYIEEEASFTSITGTFPQLARATLQSRAG